MYIRLLTREDAKLYWQLRLEALQQNPEAFSSSYEEAIKREFPIEQVAKNFEAPGNFTFGAFEEKALVGVVTLIQEQNLKLRHIANIFAMYVTPGHQGKGIGKLLVTEAINKAKTIKEIEKIKLSVVSSNEKAKRLYNSVGFQAYGFEEKALKVNAKYYDEYHMSLLL
ncbi:GNAT family N-acetyltransferase [Bacillus suaedaesalsae]|uniref:GNAT family N-acetyltransferase n=1 Tax=Bacillus suaedaesalsae TaxID=2810349 RepID=A0ABS2DG18_9BACI|nr:GNAT family N-acetyltransferase [Bacillus suaedaesalsae]MBM6617417.1 GNAT family N-acetyltransferase [Bacillus suaedaesalsae]